MNKNLNEPQQNPKIRVTYAQGTIQTRKLFSKPQVFLKPTFTLSVQF